MHPAPWPLLTLDVPAVRAAGHRPAPFRQFILKVHSRCNLSCTYCYVYEMADQGWRSLPKRMSSGMANAAVERIAEHVKEHDLAHVDVILHGGEPLLAGRDWLARLVETLHVHVPARVDVTVQTNGILLDRSTLEIFAELGVRVPAPVPARYRVPQSFGVLPGPAPAHHPRARPGTGRPAPDDRDPGDYNDGSISAVSRIPCAAARASGCSIVSISA